MPRNRDLQALNTTRVLDGTADVDVSEADYASDYVEILKVTPATGAPLRRLVVDFDLNKATTGWDTVSNASDTIDMAVLSKVDETNWRTIQGVQPTQRVANGDGSLLGNESGWRIDVGPIEADAEVSFRIKINAERGDFEVPYKLYYESLDVPTVTAVAAA